MTTGLDFTGMVPGIDFLQNLVKSSTAAMPNIPGLGAVPGMGQWVMPTLDPAELEKRISELRTVHFWLQQNAKLLEGTIQAMEVQRMTLSTLHSLNLPMSELRDALSIKSPAATVPAPTPEPEPKSAPKPLPGFKFAPDEPVAAQPEPTPQASAEDAADAAVVPPVDPMKWWGALTQQFTEIASQAMRASAAETAASVTSAAATAVAGEKRATTETAPAAKRRPRSAAPSAKKKPAAKARAR